MMKLEVDFHNLIYIFGVNYSFTLKVPIYQHSYWKKYIKIALEAAFGYVEIRKVLSNAIM